MTRGRPPSFDRDDVLQKAMAVFWAKGFAGASIADLTTATGLKPPSLYAAFGSKEGLFREVVEFYGRTDGAGTWDRASDAPTARQAVSDLLYGSAEQFSRRAKPRGCLVALSAPEADSAHSGVCDLLRGMRRDNAAMLEKRFKRAVRDGELPADADCRALAEYVATLQFGMSIQARDGVSRKALVAVADRAMAAWDALTGSAPPA